MIWKPKADLDPQRQIASAPVSLLQFNKQRWMNTTYSDFFQGQQTKGKASCDSFFSFRRYFIRYFTSFSNSFRQFV